MFFVGLCSGYVVLLLPFSVCAVVICKISFMCIFGSVFDYSIIQSTSPCYKVSLRFTQVFSSIYLLDILFVRRLTQVLSTSKCQFVCYYRQRDKCFDMCLSPKFCVYTFCIVLSQCIVCLAERVCLPCLFCVVVCLYSLFCYFWFRNLFVRDRQLWFCMDN